MSDFQLSRIYAQGWNAARTGRAKQDAARNPYAADPERTRWLEGFAAASGNKDRDD